MVAPRDDINAHDLYIPSMGFITYLLLAGLSIGIGGHFDPEKLGEFASTAFGWILLEVLVTVFALYVIQAQTDLTYIDIIAFAGYKFVPMIFSLGSGLLFGHTVYLLVFLYGCAALCFFLINSLKIRVSQVSAASAAHGQYQPGDTRRHYVTLAVAFVQPILCYM